MQLRVFLLKTLLFLILTTNSKQNTCSSISSFCQCPTDGILNCVAFTSFADLDFSSPVKNQVYKYIQLHPAGKIPFDDTVNLNGIQASVDTDVSLSNIDSFQLDLNSNPFRNLAPNGAKLNKLEIERTTFAYKYLGDSLANKCSLGYVDLSSLRPMFAEFSTIQLRDTVVYPTFVCPFIFKSAHLTNIIVSNLSSANNLQFVDNLSLVGTELDAKIRTFEIYQSRIRLLDTRLLNKNVFKYVENLIISDSQLDAIEETLFSHFEHIRTIQLKLTNMDAFFRVNNNSNWTAYLNRSAQNDPGKQILVGFIDTSFRYAKCFYFFFGLHCY